MLINLGDSRVINERAGAAKGVGPVAQCSVNDKGSNLKGYLDIN
jgi:hypothetical protein